MMALIRNIEFKRVYVEFENSMKKDIRVMKENKQSFIPADKLRNVCTMNPKEFNEVLSDNITELTRNPTKITLTHSIVNLKR